MPTRELITLNGKSRRGFNVSETVGFAGQNKTGDVLLIQAMFNYISMGLGQGGIGGALEALLLPELTGVMDPPTMRAISNFPKTVC